MPKLGLTTSLGASGLTTPGIVTDNLVMKHKYPAGAVQPLSDGAAQFSLSAGNTNECITIGDIQDLSTTDFSIVCWFYPSSNIAEYDNLVSQREITGGSRGFQFDIRDGGEKLGIALTDSDNTVTIAGDITISPNQWHHGAVVVDRSDKAYLYHNGVFDKSTASITSITTGLEHTDGIFTIGARQDEDGTINNEFSGYICNVGFWNRVLTQAEIKSIMWKQYADLSTSEKSSLVSWWNLDNIPYSGNAAHNSSLIGALQYEDGASDIGYGAHASMLEFAPTNDIELGADIFGGEGSFTTDTGYWSLSNDTRVENGLVITDSGAGSGNYNAISKGSILTDGKIYKLSFDIIDYVDGGDLKFRFNWAQDSTGSAYPWVWKAVDGKGSFYCYFEPGGSTVTTLTMYASDTGGYGEIKLDNLVCQEVLNAGVLK